MQTFDFKFTVTASLQAVSDFHHDSSILKTLTPPPLYAQIHQFDPMGEGAVAKFTLWFGPFPIRWEALHTNVSINGFTDTQQQGPLESWQHTHRFTAVSPSVTQIHEHIEYEHPQGIQGLPTRLMFGKLGLVGLFTARKFITRYHIAKTLKQSASSSTIKS